MGCCGKIAKGAAGVTKAVTHIDRPVANVIEARRMLCRVCEHAVPCPAVPARKCFCDRCDCILRAKTAVASEACPAGKWAAHQHPPPVTTDSVMSVTTALEGNPAP